MITRIPLHTNDERGKVRHFHVHMMATIAVIAAITEKKKSSAIAAIIMETTFQRSQRQPSLRENFFCAIATIAGKSFPYDRCDC